MSATTLLVLAADQAPPRTALGAEVRAEAAVGGTVLLVTNTSSTNWTDVTFTLNGIFIARQAALTAGRSHHACRSTAFAKAGWPGNARPGIWSPRRWPSTASRASFKPR